MSLILEALRKSEAERRRGRAPDLHAELPPPPAPRRRMPAAWLAAVSVVAVLLLVAVVFRPRGEDAAIAQRDASRPDVAPIEEGSPRARDDTTDRNATPSSTTTPPAFPPIERLSPPIASVAEGAPPEAAPPVEQTSPATTRTRDSSDIARPPETTPPDLPPPANLISPTPAQTAPPSAGNADTPIRYAELPLPERQQLPPMKLTMHLWNEDPTLRFVIIDDRRYGEGDRIGSGVVAAIDPDGVIVELNGRSVRLPLR